MAVLKGKEKNIIASVMGALAMGSHTGMMFGSFAAGVMMDVFGLNYVFYLSAAFMLGITVFFGKTYNE